MHLVDTSIIICNYNYGRFISRAIRSCLHQTENDSLEVIVIDDASTDNSMEVLGNFKDRIKVVSLPQNKGVAYCSNLGIRKADGMFVMRVDADDFIHQKTVEVLKMHLCMNPDYAFAYSDHVRVSDFDDTRERIHLDTVETLKNHGAGVLFKKSCLEAVGLYDEEMRNCEDYLLIERLIQEGYHGIHVQLPLYKYYRHHANMTNDQHSRKEWEKIAKEKANESRPTFN